MSQDSVPITDLIAKAKDKAGFDALIEAVYPNLHALAASVVGRSPSAGDVRPTDVASRAAMKLEAVLKHPPKGEFEGRRQFFEYARKTMHSVRNDLLRGYLRHAAREELLDENLSMSENETLFRRLLIDQALRHLDRVAKDNPTLERRLMVMELFYYGGHSYLEIAQMLDMPVKQVTNDLSDIRARLIEICEDELL